MGPWRIVKHRDALRGLWIPANESYSIRDVQAELRRLHVPSHPLYMRNDGRLLLVPSKQERWANYVLGRMLAGEAVPGSRACVGRAEHSFCVLCRICQSWREVLQCDYSILLGALTANSLQRIKSAQRHKRHTGQSETRKLPKEKRPASAFSADVCFPL